MATEKDIKRFMQDHKIPVPKDDKFMADLVRQIDLLPVPAALIGRDEEKMNENLRIVGLIRETFRKRYRRQALAVLIADIVICSFICLIGYLVLTPEVTATPVLQFISTWRYLFVGIINAGLLLFWCRSVDRSTI